MLNDNSFKIDLPIGKEPTIVIPNPTSLNPSYSTSASVVSPTMASTDSMQGSSISNESPTVVEDAQRATTVETTGNGRCAPTSTALALQVAL